MIDLLQPYMVIALSLSQVWWYFDLSSHTGKAQLAQITPLDTVSAFVIGALVGGVLYNPEYVYVAYFICFGSVDSVQHAHSLCYAVGSFAPFHKRRERASCKRWCYKLQEFQAKTVLKWNSSACYYARKESSLCSMLKTYCSRLMVLLLFYHQVNRSASFLLVNNGEIVETTLKQCDRSSTWVLRNIKRNGFEAPSQLFCMEWTPNKGSISLHTLAM